MKESDDKILQDYLQGEDGVSSAYGELRQEKPSAALDERILQASREAVADKKAASKQIPIQAYSIAASICLMVLATALFLQNEEELTGARLESSAIPVMDTADDAVQTEADLNQATSLQLEAFQAAPASAEVQRAQQAGADEQATPQADGNTNALRLEAQQDALATQARQAETQLSTLAEAAQAEEQAFAYRNNAESWLAEIQRLISAENTQEANTERSLFVQQFPDIDIDAALAEQADNN